MAEKASNHLMKSHIGIVIVDGVGDGDGVNDVIDGDCGGVGVSGVGDGGGEDHRQHAEKSE